MRAVNANGVDDDSHVSYVVSEYGDAVHVHLIRYTVIQVK